MTISCGNAKRNTDRVVTQKPRSLTLPLIASLSPTLPRNLLFGSSNGYFPPPLSIPFLRCNQPRSSIMDTIGDLTPTLGIDRFFFASPRHDALEEQIRETLTMPHYERKERVKMTFTVKKDIDADASQVSLLVPQHFLDYSPVMTATINKDWSKTDDTGCKTLASASFYLGFLLYMCTQLPEVRHATVPVVSDLRCEQLLKDEVIELHNFASFYAIDFLKSIIKRCLMCYRCHTPSPDTLMIAYREKYVDIYQQQLQRYASCLSSFHPDLLKAEPAILSDIISTIAHKQQTDAAKHDILHEKHSSAIKRCLHELDAIEPPAHQAWKKTRSMVERLAHAPYPM